MIRKNFILIQIYIFLLLAPPICFSQVFSNNGAVMSVASSTEISNVSDIENTIGTIDNNGTLTATGNITNDGTLSGNGTYKIAGNFTNNGTFTAGSGTVLFNGTSVLSGSTQLTTFNNLTVNNSKTLNIAPTKQVTVNGTLSNNGNFALKGDVSGSASLLDNGIAGTGTYSFEQYITGTRWWYISSPMTSATTGVYNADNTIDNGIFYFDEPTNVYVRVTNTTTRLNPMQGWSTKFKNIANRTNIYQGTVNTGILTIPLTGTSQQWNLCGNPYPSAIDWEAASGWTKINVRSDIYVRKDGTYATYSSESHLGTNGGSRYIAAGQAIWVKCVAATGTLGMTNSVRVQNSQALMRLGDPPNTLRVTADRTGYKDETVISFNVIASDNFDNYDSEKMFGGDNNFPQLYIVIGAKKTAVDVMRAFTTDRDIPLGFKAGLAGTYTFSFESVETFDPNTIITLEDRLLSTFTNLRTTPSYTFASVVADNNTRFIIHFKAPSGLPVTLLNFDAVAKDKVVNLNWSTSAEINNAIFTIERSQDGNIFEPLLDIQGAGFSNTLKNYSAVDEHPFKGTSYYRLKQTDFDGHFSYSDIITVNISDAASQFDFTQPFYNGNNILTEISVAAETTVTIDIIDNTGKTVYSETFKTSSTTLKTIPASGIADGVYVFRLTSESKSMYKKFALVKN